MLITAIRNQNNPYLNSFKTRSSVSVPLSFKSSKDSYTPSIRIKEEEFNENIPTETREQIKEGIIKIIQNDNKPRLGTGANGAVYKLDNITGDKQYVIKVPHLEPRNPITGERQRINHDFSNERKVLKSIDKLDKNFQKFAGYFQLSDGRNVIVTTYIGGKEPDIKTKKLNEKNLASILEMLYRLDCNGTLHRDLKKENIRIDDNDNAGIFDFSEGISFDILNTKYNTKENHFPIFEMPTNLRNFEDTLLSPYLFELSKTNPDEAKTLFINYLKLKSDFHAGRAEYISGRLSEENLSKQDKKHLEKMMKYEKTLSQVFKDPDEDIVNIELLKNNITYNSELAYKNQELLLNPLANITLKSNSIIEAKKMEDLVNKTIKKPSTMNKKQYLLYKKYEARFRQYKLASWINGVMDWFLKCMKTDINDADENVKGFINQCTGDKDLRDFEIPDIKF